MKRGEIVECIDTEGDFDTTLGNSYKIAEINADNAITITDDAGDFQICFMENFKSVDSTVEPEGK